jgi:hypothetical protein
MLDEGIGRHVQQCRGIGRRDTYFPLGVRDIGVTTVVVVVVDVPVFGFG